MATTREKKNRKLKRTKTPNSEIGLSNILELGGKKDDYELIEGLDMDGEGDLENFGSDDEDDAKMQSDIKQMISKLGFKGFTSADETKVKKYKKVKGEEKLEANLIGKHGSASDVSEKQSKKNFNEVAKNSKTLSRPATDSSPQKSRDLEVQKKNNTSPPKKPSKREQRNKYKSVQVSEVSSSTMTPSQWALQMTESHKPRKFLLVKTGGRWFDNEPQDPVEFDELPESVLTTVKNFAQKLYEEDVALYIKQRNASRKSEAGWMKTVVSSGTVSDKMAALTILIQDAPVHNVVSMVALINMVKKKSRRENIMAVDTLKELFTNDLIPDTRKLRTFEQHPFLQLDELTSGNHDARDKRLVLWYYESLLKEHYTTFVEALKTMLRDSVQASKKKSLDTIFELLVGKPEQEKTLLELIINKLGDPDVKLASRSAHLLVRLVDKHPRMKGVVVKEVEQLLYRPNINVKAQYYAICFLNQLVLNPSDHDLAAHLIAVYFSFFKAFVKKGEVDSKMLSALLSGVNRAYPYAKMDKEKIEEQMTTLYKVVHIVNFNVSVQALMLLYQVMDSSDEISDRYYTALYRKLLDPGLKSSSKHALFLNVLFKSLRKDTVNKRIKAFIKRLLQVSSLQSPSFICAVLILISEVVKVQKGLVKVQHTAEDSDDEEHFTDVRDDDDEEMKAEDKQTHSTGHKSGSWVHRSVADKSDTGEYDPQHRNPLYCHAELDCEWELERLSHHFHPSVALFAKTLLKGDSISYASDPLQDFTLIRFLDRFVYRNPKKKVAGDSHTSVMQPKRRTAKPRGARGVAVNSDEYINKSEDAIPEDEKFFYKYFSQKAAKKKEKEKKLEDFDSDAESISDNDFDAYLDKYETGVEETGDVDFGVDFASEFSKQLGKKKKTKVGSEMDLDDDDDEEEDDDDDDDDDLDDQLSDEEMDFGDDLKDAFGDDNDPGFDEEAIEFSDDDDLAPFGTSSSKRSKKMKGRKVNELVESDLSDIDDVPVIKKSKKGGKLKGSDISSIFASAEEFAHMIDENVNSKIDSTGSQAMSNKDNADAKQLKWEMNRDKWLNDRDWRSKKRGKGHFKGSKSGIRGNKKLGKRR